MPDMQLDVSIDKLTSTMKTNRNRESKLTAIKTLRHLGKGRHDVLLNLLSKLTDSDVSIKQ